MAGHQDTHAAGNLIHWMGRFETMSSASKKKVARSSKLKELVTGLVDYDPDTMEKLLKQASKACVASLKRKAVPVKAKQVRVPAESEDLTPPPAKRAKLPRFVRKPLPSITNIQRSTTAVMHPYFK